MKKDKILIIVISSIVFSLVFTNYLSNDQRPEIALFQNQDKLPSPPSLPSTQQEANPSQILMSIFENPQDIGSIVFDYLNGLIREIAKDSSFYDLIGFAIGMVIYGIFVFHFYRFLSKRDMFSMNLDRRLSQRKFKSSGEAISVTPRVIGFIATNLFIYPFVIFLWFVGYSAIMFLLVPVAPTATIFLVTSSLIIAVRISAYYNEDLSRDLAKLLPFALLAIFLYNPQLFSFNNVLDKIADVPTFIIQIAAFMLVAMLVEIVLSILYLIKLKFFHNKEKTKKIDDSEHPI